MEQQNNNYRQTEQDRRIVELEMKMDKVFGHIAKTNEEMGNIRANVNWLVKFFWLVATSSVGALIGTLVNLVVRLR